MPKARNGAVPLILILTAAAGLRLIGLDAAPPGIHHDEASNGYDAWCLLKTGADRWGQPFPVLLEAFGRCDHRGALAAYLMVPFHAIFGPDHMVISTRAPAAVLGVISVWALYYVVRRTSDASTALWAALALTISPWHLQITRFGHEAGLTPACTIGALALLVSAIPSEMGGRISRWRLVAAAVAVGLSPYSYPSMRLFTPLFFMALAVVFRREIAGRWRAREDRMSILVAIAVGGIVLAPMAWLTVTEPDRVFARAAQTSVFHQGATGAASLGVFIAQYMRHFSPVWLFVTGDQSLVQGPPGGGQLSPAMAPFLVIGLILAVRRWKTWKPGRVLWVWILLAPLAASATQGGPHALRSACGLPAYQWLAAIGVTWFLGWLDRARRPAMTGAVLAAFLVNGVWTSVDYFAARNRNAWVRAYYQDDLLRAMRRIRPMVDDFDRVFVSDQRGLEERWYSGEPYVIALLGLAYSPAEFHADAKVIDYERPTDGFHRVTSFGSVTLTTRRDGLDAFFADFQGQSALFLVRPGELQGGELVDTIRGHGGEARFEIIAVRPRPNTR
jgi:4-amino-4-deoxy-L-arabinose transferase-like glycosyltransferase